MLYLFQINKNNNIQPERCVYLFTFLINCLALIRPIIISYTIVIVANIDKNETNIFRYLYSISMCVSPFISRCHMHTCMVPVFS